MKTNASLVLVTAMLLLAAHPVVAQDSPSTIVAVFAHADDETSVAPILSRYARQGAQVYVIVATDGAQGGKHTTIPRGPELARTRAAEARCSAAALEIQPPILLDFPDAKLGDYLDEPARLPRLAERVQAELQRLKPDAVITWGPDGATTHPDHRLVSAIVTQLARAGAPGVPDRVFYASLPAAGFRIMNPTGPEPRYVIPQEKYFTARIAFDETDFDRARRAMACHRTQYSDDIVERIFAAERSAWNGVIALSPLDAAHAGTDLLR
jgi:LmbE family N-acetylglucosaminyl deacetylase